MLCDYQVNLYLSKNNLIRPCSLNQILHPLTSLRKHSIDALPGLTSYRFVSSMRQLSLNLECIQPAWTLIRLACFMLQDHANMTFALCLGLDATVRCHQHRSRCRSARSVSLPRSATCPLATCSTRIFGAAPAGPVERPGRDPARPNAQSHPELRRRGPEDRAPAEEDWLGSLRVNGSGAGTRPWYTIGCVGIKGSQQHLSSNAGSQRSFYILIPSSFLPAMPILLPTVTPSQDVSASRLWSLHCHSQHRSRSAPLSTTSSVQSVRPCVKVTIGSCGLCCDTTTHGFVRDITGCSGKFRSCN